MPSSTTALEDIDPRLAARGFGWTRIAIGVVLFGAPSLFGRAFRAGSTPAVVAAVRAAAIRDLALGIGTVQAQEDRELVRWVEAGMVADAGDVVALVRARGMRPAVRLGVLATAAGATVLGGMMRRALR